MTLSKRKKGPTKAIIKEDPSRDWLLTFNSPFFEHMFVDLALQTPTVNAKQRPRTSASPKCLPRSSGVLLFYKPGRENVVFRTSITDQETAFVVRPLR